MSVALTESKTSRTNPVKIKALIVKDGIFDWTGLGTTLPPSTSSTEPEDIQRSMIEAATGPWTSSHLTKLLPTLFSSPEGAFDHFASPMLFFRTSGLNVPKYFPGQPSPSASPPSQNGNQARDEVWADGFQGYDESGLPIYSVPPSPSPSLLSAGENGGSEESAEQWLGKRTSELDISPPARKSHLKYPPPGTDLVIPPTLLLWSSPTPSITSPDPSSTDTKNKIKGKSQASKQAAKSASKRKTSLKSIKQELGLGGISPESQAVEIRALMVRSVEKYEEDHRGDVKGSDEAESRVLMEEVNGDGTKDGDGDGNGGVGKEDEVLREFIEGLL